MKELYQKLKNGILNLGNITLETKKNYIDFKHNNNVCDVMLRKNKLVIFKIYLKEKR